MYDNRGAAMFEQEMRDRLAAATADINQLREQLTAMTARAEAAEAKLAAVPVDDIQRMQGCEAHTKRTEWAKIRVANWLLQQGRRGYPPERANITIDGETCPCCGDSDVYKDATGTWRQCGDCEYAWQPKQQEAQP